MLPNSDMAAITQHVLLASTSTSQQPQVPLHRRVANLEKPIHRSQRADHVAKHAAMRGFSVGQWLD